MIDLVVVHAIGPMSLTARQSNAAHCYMPAKSYMQRTALILRHAVKYPPIIVHMAAMCD